MNRFLRFLKNDSGATAIEYGLIAGAISIVIIAAVAVIGDQLFEVFDNIAVQLGGKSSAASDAVR